MKVAILSLVAVCALAGCAGKSPEPAPAPPRPPSVVEQVQPDVDLLEQANQLAASLLEQYNATPDAQAAGTNLKLGDYRRTMRSESIDGNPYFIVTYTLKHILSTEATPYEFSVVTDKTSGETQILR